MIPSEGANGRRGVSWHGARLILPILSMLAAALGPAVHVWLMGPWSDSERAMSWVRLWPTLLLWEFQVLVLSIVGVVLCRTCRKPWGIAVAWALLGLVYVFGAVPNP